MTKATFVNYFYRSYQVLLTCYYTQVSYTGSFKPLVVLVNECSFECSTGVFLFAIFRLNNVKSTARRPKRGLGSFLLARKQEMEHQKDRYSF
jgi:hypothetical protein